MSDEARTEAELDAELKRLGCDPDILLRNAFDSLCALCAAQSKQIQQLQTPHTSHLDKWEHCAPIEPGLYWYAEGTATPVIMELRTDGLFTYHDSQGATYTAAELGGGRFWLRPIEPPETV